MFIKNFVEKWRTPALTLTKNVYNRIFDRLKDLLKNTSSVSDKVTWKIKSSENLNDPKFSS